MLDSSLLNKKGSFAIIPGALLSDQIVSQYTHGVFCCPLTPDLSGLGDEDLEMSIIGEVRCIFVANPGLFACYYVSDLVCTFVVYSPVACTFGASAVPAGWSQCTGTFVEDNAVFSNPFVSCSPPSFAGLLDLSPAYADFLTFANRVFQVKQDDVLYSFDGVTQSWRRSVSPLLGNPQLVAFLPGALMYSNASGGFSYVQPPTGAGDFLLKYTSNGPVWQRTASLAEVVVVSEAGATSGNTHLTTEDTGVLFYKVGTAAETVYYGQFVPGWDKYTDAADYEMANGSVLSVVSVDTDGRVIGFGTVTVISKTDTE